MPTNSKQHRFMLYLTAIFLFATLAIFTNCKKSFEKNYVKDEQMVQPPPGGGGECDLNTTACLDCDFQEQIEESYDSTEDQYPTILGDEYVNPYSIPVMTEAYNIIHSTNIQAVGATHLYICKV